MIYDFWIFADETEWNALDPDVDNVDRYVYENAIKGFWKDDSSGFTPYNIVATKAQIDQFSTALGANMRLGQIWEQGTGKAARAEEIATYRTDATEILSVMKNNIVADEGGTIVSNTSATRENPNWGHVFSGQPNKDFAGFFSNSFSKEFY